MAEVLEGGDLEGLQKGAQIYQAMMKNAEVISWGVY